MITYVFQKYPENFTFKLFITAFSVYKQNFTAQ